MKTSADPSRPVPSRSRTAATRTPAEVRAAETNRVAREMIDAATEKRVSQVAKLREARLAKEAEERDAAAVAATMEPAKKTRSRKKV